MAVSLKKGQGVRLKKEGSNEGLKSITLGLNWKGRKIIKSTGFFGKLFGDNLGIEPVDLDSAILCYKGNEYIDMCYFGNKSYRQNNKEIIHHYGDDVRGDNKQTKIDNEQIKINLKDIDITKIATLYLVMNIFTSGITLKEIVGANAKRTFIIKSSNFSFILSNIVGGAGSGL